MSELAIGRPQAAVFDCDGLLVDTETCWTIAEAEVFASRGLDYGPELKPKFIGKSVAATVQLMAETFGEVGREPEIHDQLMTLIGEVIGGQAEAMPGALELVRRLRGRLPVAVASNSPRYLVELSLSRAGLVGSFDAVVGADEVATGKPAPDLYLRACELLGAAPSTSFAFEDSAVGVASAKAAGMTVIGVPSLDPTDFPSDLVFSSLAAPELLAWADSL